MSETFTTRIVLGGKTATGFGVPAEVVERFGRGKRPKVVVRIGSHTYRSTVAVYAGEFMVPLNAGNREAAGVEAGDTVEVTLSLDDAERSVEVPEALAAAFREHPGSAERFAALSYSNQRERVESVAGAKRPETRERRVAKIVAELA